MSAYSIVLTLHSIVRYFVIVGALVALVLTYAGWLGHRPWTTRVNSASLFFTSFLDMQVLIGVILFFFLSPITTALFTNFSGTINSPVASYFTFEHVLPMLVAVVLAHIGSARAKRAANDQARYRQAAVFYTLAVIAILLAIPWPFYPFGRPLV